MTTKYNSLGIGIFKYNQALAFICSLLIIAINFMLGSSLFFWTFLIGMLLIINLIWYLFSDIKWNSEFFVIEKFLRKNEIPSSRFVKIDRIFFNVFVIRFTTSKFYYAGDFKSLFESPIDITNTIKANLNKG